MTRIDYIVVWEGPTKRRYLAHGRGRAFVTNSWTVASRYMTATEAKHAADAAPIVSRDFWIERITRERIDVLDAVRAEQGAALVAANTPWPQPGEVHAALSVDDDATSVEMCDYCGSLNHTDIRECPEIDAAQLANAVHPGEGCTFDSPESLDGGWCTKCHARRRQSF